MFCPYYKNKEIFDSFNSIIEAFGGKPMTEEEFKSSELRNQREGLDYSAMEAAYKIWHRNGGNPIDKAPNGQSSILYNTLLDLFEGDSLKAIRAKAKVYSQSFLNWFGDWVNDPDNASKVVDENGEPLVVYHHTDNPNLTEFSTDFENYFSKDGGTKEAIFFDENETGTLGRKHDIPVFLNIRELNEYNETKQQLHDRGTTYREVVNQSAEKNNKDGGVHMKDFDDNKMEHQSIWIVHNSNQIKSATDNIGTFSTTDNNIYHLNISSTSTELSTFAPTQKIPNSFQRLSNGETVSSDDIASEISKDQTIGDFQQGVWELLSTLNVPIRLSDKLGELTFGRTAVNEDGQSIIEINSDLLHKLPTFKVYEHIMHEILHAKTSYILDNPSTEELRALSHTTKYVFDSFLLKLQRLSILPILSVEVRYAMTSEKEFLSEILSSTDVRRQLFDIARTIDNKLNNRFVNAIKRLINKAVDVLFNKVVFNTTENQLQQYVSNLKQYLLNTRYKQQKMFTSKELDQMYSSLNANSLLLSQQVDDYNTLEKRVLLWKIDNLVVGQEQNGQPTYNPDGILDELTLRLVSIQTRDLDAATKSNAISATELLITVFQNPQTPRYTQISVLVDYINSQIREYATKLHGVLNSDEQISYAELQYMSRDTFNVYSSVMKQIDKWLNEDLEILKIIDQYNTSGLGDKITTNDVLDLKLSVKNASSILTECQNLSEQVVKKLGLKSLAKIGEEVNSPTILEHIASYDLDNVFEDTGSLWVWMGSAEFSDNETVRAIVHLISKTDSEVERDAKEVVYKGLAILNKFKNGQKMTDIYERDENGDFTQYLLRDLNFGRFYKEYDKALIEINKKLGLPLENRVAPDDSDLKIKFNQLRNRWLSKNAHRKFVNEYYDAWDGVPTFVRQRVQMFNDQIDLILAKYDIRDKDGYPDYSKLPEGEYKNLRSLIISKRALRQKYDEYGREKQPGEPDYEIYMSLKQLDEKLKALKEKITGKPQGSDISYAESQWRSARNKIIERAGGQEEYDKYLKGEDNHFNALMLNKWDLYNSHLDFKRDEDGEALIFKGISKLLNGLDKTINYGQKYNEISEQVNSILSIFRNEMGEVDIEKIPESTLNLLTNRKDGLLYQLTRLKQEALSRNPRIRSLSKQKAELMRLYLLKVETERFKILKQNIGRSLSGLLESGGTELYDIEFYSRLSKYGYQYGDEMYDFTPYMFALKSEAKDKSNYMELKPNYNWIERDRDVFKNPLWTDKYGTSLIPIREKYDNSDAFNKMYNNDVLREFYEYAHEWLSRSNKLLTNRDFTDDYLLPSITSDGFDQVLHTKWGRKLQVLTDVVLEKLGFPSRQPVQDIEDIGTDAIADKVDIQSIPQEDGSSERESLSEKTNPRRKLLRQYATAEEFHILPQYYTRKLDDPSIINRNLIHILSNYYFRSLQYSARVKIKDECETLLDLIGSKRNEETVGKTSGAYQEARKYINRNIYDERRSSKSVGNLGWQYTRALSNFRNATTAVNLGAKPSIGITAFISTLYKYIENSFGMGDYSILDCFKSLGRLFISAVDPRKLAKIPFQISTTNTNQYTTSKRTAIAAYYDLAELFENAIDHIEQNWLLRTIRKHSIYGFMTMTDYLTKTTIAEGILRSYRYVDNLFITKQLLENRRLVYGEDVYAEKLKQYKKAKSLYSLLKNKNGQIEIDDQYKEAERNVYTLVKKDIQNTAQMMDGIPTASQRTNASSNPLGMFFFIHRNYISVLTQRYWRNSVYSYEQLRYVNGLHRHLVDFIAEMLRNNLLLGSLATAGIGLSIGGGFGALVGGLAGLTYGKYSRSVEKKQGIVRDKKSIKQVVYDAYKTDLSSNKNYHESLHRQRSIKQIIAELAMHYVVFSILLENLFFPYADDDKHKDQLITQLLAYGLRKGQLETFNQYSFSDAVSTFKSATAAQSLIDKFEIVFNSLAFTLFPNGNTISQFGLWDAFRNLYEEDTIKSGAYKGWNRGVRNAWRLIPYSNFFHETSDNVNPIDPNWGGKSVYDTRRYYENTVLHIKHRKSESDKTKKKKSKKR